jgi:paraquat-inducible protein B
MDSTMRVAAQMMDEIAVLARTLNDRVPQATDQLITTSAQLASLLEEAQQTLRTTAEMVAPGSPVMVELEASLREIAAAARALRQLTEYLERNPSALLRGRAEERKP